MGDGDKMNNVRESAGDRESAESLTTDAPLTIDDDAQDRSIAPPG